MTRGSAKPQEPRLRNGIKAFDLSTLPACGARTRQGRPCKRYGNKINGRCRLHGGQSTGPKRRITGIQHHNFRTGYHTRKAKQQRKQVSALIQACQRLYRQEISDVETSI